MFLFTWKWTKCREKSVNHSYISVRMLLYVLCFILYLMSVCCEPCIFAVGVNLVVCRLHIVFAICTLWLTMRWLSVHRPLNRQFAERLKSVFLQTMQNPGSNGNAAQKKSSGELAEKISGLWVNAKLFEKGFKLFDGKRICFVDDLNFNLLIVIIVKKLSSLQCLLRTTSAISLV